MNRRNINIDENCSWVKGLTYENRHYTAMRLCLNCVNYSINYVPGGTPPGFPPGEVITQEQERNKINVNEFVLPAWASPWVSPGHWG